MKKLIPLILIVLMAVFAISCDGSNPEPNPNEGSNTTDETVTPPDANGGADTDENGVTYPTDETVTPPSADKVAITDDKVTSVGKLTETIKAALYQTSGVNETITYYLKLRTWLGGQSEAA